MPHYRQQRRQRITVENQLRVESLEGRIVLTAGIGYDPTTRVLAITGSEGNDVAEVRQQGRNLLVSLNDGIQPLSATYRASAVRQIVFNGLGGNDSFTNLTGIRCRADGGLGEDVLRGGRAADELIGGDDNDQLLGNGGNDQLDGGPGADVLRGGTGNDREIGGLGNDQLFGEDGNDDLSGGDDDDAIDGGRGNDTGRGDDGLDRLLGGPGVDLLLGGRGDDSIDGGLNNDREYGEDGDDDLHGGPGNDFLSGGLGSDDIFGDSGRDTLEGNEGDDQLDGNTGRDRIRGGAGLDHEVDAEDRFEDGDDDGDGFDNDHDRPVDPGVAVPVVFSGAGTAQVTGTSVSEDDKKYFSFTAAENRTLTVASVADGNGRYAKIDVRNVTTGRELLELEPDDDHPTTSGQVVLVAGNSYLLRVRSPFSSLAVDFTVDLDLS